MSTDWSRVYLECYGDLVRFLHRKVWDADQAHDLAQEAFMKSLRASPDNPRAWVFQVARNLAADEARTAGIRRRHLELIKSDAEDSTHPDPATEFEQRERSRRVRAALSELTERDREALLLWDAGFDYEEIAEQTELSPRSVGTTLARARRRLVEAFRSLEDTDAASG